MDGSDALQNEDAEARRHRDGAARAGLQSEESDGDPRNARAAQGDLSSCSPSFPVGGGRQTPVLTQPHTKAGHRSGRRDSCYQSVYLNVAFMLQTKNSGLPSS